MFRKVQCMYEHVSVSLVRDNKVSLLLLWYCRVNGNNDPSVRVIMMIKLSAASSPLLLQSMAMDKRQWVVVVSGMCRPRCAILVLLLLLLLLSLLLLLCVEEVQFRFVSVLLVYVPVCMAMRLLCASHFTVFCAGTHSFTSPL